MGVSYKLYTHMYINELYSMNLLFHFEKILKYIYLNYQIKKKNWKYYLDKVKHIYLYMNEILVIDHIKFKKRKW